MKLELGQYLAVREAEILDHEVALALVRPRGGSANPEPADFRGRQGVAEGAAPMEARGRVELCGRRAGQCVAPAPPANAQARASRDGCAASAGVRWVWQLPQIMGRRRER